MGTNHSLDSIPEDAYPLLDGPEFATLGTIEPSGAPQLSLIWVARDGGDVLFSTVRGRRKTDNLEADSRASLLIFPAGAPSKYLEVRGTVALEDDPDGSLIHRLAREYTGADRYSADTPGTPRVIARLTPSKVIWRT